MSIYSAQWNPLKLLLDLLKKSTDNLHIAWFIVGKQVYVHPSIWQKKLSWSVFFGGIFLCCAWLLLIQVGLIWWNAACTILQSRFDVSRQVICLHSLIDWYDVIIMFLRVKELYLYFCINLHYHWEKLAFMIMYNKYTVLVFYNVDYI